MKLTTNTRFEPAHVVTAQEAVTYRADRCERMFDGREERAIARGLALEQMLGNLIAAMIENGQLREHQLEAIFDYDVGAEA